MTTREDPDAITAVSVRRYKALEAENNALRARVAELEVERDYWRRRARALLADVEGDT